MKTIFSHSGIKIVVACGLLLGAASAQAGNVSFGLSVGVPVEIPVTAIYTSHPVAHRGPPMMHHRAYYHHGWRPYHARSHYAPAHHYVPSHYAKGHVVSHNRSMPQRQGRPAVPQRRGR